MSSDTIYTVDQVAQMLDMHPRTIRRHIREGKLKASKVGGEWRVRKMDLGELFSNVVGETYKRANDDVLGFVEGDYSERDGKVQVCTVLDYYVEKPEDASPMCQTLINIMNSSDPDQGKARFQYVFDKGEGKARFIFWGNPKFIAKLLLASSDYS